MYSGRIIVASDAATIGSSCVQHLQAAANEAIDRKGTFTIAVSGGSIPSILAGAFDSIARANSSDLSKWRIIFADERCVPLDHADSNYLAWETHVFRPLRSQHRSFIAEDNILRIAYSEDPAQVCSDYEGRLSEWISGEGGGIDVVLLGMGPDGHTASLFPGHALVTSMLTEEEEAPTRSETPFVAYLTDSPKPPPTRITLTLAAINSCKQIIFVATGAAKAPVLRQFITPTAPQQQHADDCLVYDCNIAALPEFPASIVHSKSGSSVIWFLDRDAASFLS